MPRRLNKLQVIYIFLFITLLITAIIAVKLSELKFDLEKIPIINDLIQATNHLTNGIIYPTKQTGCAKLGEGTKGVVFDTQCPEGNESLYSTLNSYGNEILQIVLFSPTGEYTLEKKDIVPFIDYIKTSKNTIAKIIKSKQQKTHKKPSLYNVRIDDEVRSNMMIIEKFGIYSKKYLTIKPNLLFGDISVVCCKIIYDSKKEPTYIIFGEKCGLIKQVNLDKLINDILECLKFTEKKSILHNDIKYENIMYCDNRYKLIDWGNASFHNIQRGGLFTGPLKKYMTGHTLEESRNDLHTKLASRFQSLYDSKIFKEVHNRILNEFDIILTKTNDREKLKRDYKGNHDLFSFGLTILHIVVLENLDYNKYSRIIMALTSYISPMTASRAYDYSKDLYGETPYCTGL